MARDLYKEGDAAYAEGRYEDALTAFRESHELSQRPLLLYNIGNALERLGRLAESADALEKYLPHAKPSERATLQKRIENLRKRAKDASAGPAPVPVEPTPSKHTPPQATTPTDRQPRRPEHDAAPAPAGPPTLGWVLLGVGGVALGAGAVFGVMALGARKDMDGGCKDSAGQRLCSADAQDAIDRDRRYSLLADIGFGAGIVAAGVGTLLLLSTPDDAGGGKQTLSAGAALAPGGGFLRVRADF